jgi:hypothetical protein
MQRTSEGTRARWANRRRSAALLTLAEDRSAGHHAAARRQPLSSARAAADFERATALGPYETSYDVQHGYGIERTIIQP